MEQALQIAASIGLQFLFLCAAVVFVIGFRVTFLTRDMIPWPWFKKPKIDSEKDISYRRGTAAGMYYSALAIQQCGINNVRACAERREQMINQAQHHLTPEVWDHFKAGTMEGIDLMDAILTEQRVQAIVRHMPEIQSYVAQIRNDVMHAATLCDPKTLVSLESAIRSIHKLQGITQ